MNMRQGRIGNQEAASLALLACVISGLFAMNTKTQYANGNSAYISSPLAAMLSLLVLLPIYFVMRRKGIRNLAELYRFAFGPVLAVLAATLTLGSILYAAAMPLLRLLLIMDQYIYAQAALQNIALYQLPCVLILSWMGLEILGRTAKLFVIPVILSLVATFLIAIPAYEAFRLFPLLGNGLPQALWYGVTGMGRFLPALLCLLICGTGVHGPKNAAQGAAIGAVGSAVIVGGSRLLIGMAYPYYMLSQMPTPMYRVTMAVSGAKVYLRADKILLFFWILGGMLAGGFYAYAGALVFAGACRMRDIRPAVAAVALVICALAMMGHLSLDYADEVERFLQNTVWAFSAAPPLLAALVAAFKKGRC